MPQLKVHVITIDEDKFPGFAEFELVDLTGTTHMFTEKLSVVGIDIQETPYFAWIECTQIQKKANSVIVSTQEPHGVECKNGITEFEIPTTSFR